MDSPRAPWAGRPCRSRTSQSGCSGPHASPRLGGSPRQRSARLDREGHPPDLQLESLGVIRVHDAPNRLEGERRITGLPVAKGVEPAVVQGRPPYPQPLKLGDDGQHPRRRHVLAIAPTAPARLVRLLRRSRGRAPAIFEKPRVDAQRLVVVPGEDGVEEPGRIEGSARLQLRGRVELDSGSDAAVVPDLHRQGKIHRPRGQMPEGRSQRSRPERHDRHAPSNSLGSGKPHRVPPGESGGHRNDLLQADPFARPVEGPQCRWPVARALDGRQASLRDVEAIEGDRQRSCVSQGPRRGDRVGGGIVRLDGQGHVDGLRTAAERSRDDEGAARAAGGGGADLGDASPGEVEAKGPERPAVEGGFRLALTASRIVEGQRASGNEESSLETAGLIHRELRGGGPHQGGALSRKRDLHERRRTANRARSEGQREGAGRGDRRDRPTAHGRRRLWRLRLSRVHVHGTAVEATCLQWRQAPRVLFWALAGARTGTGRRTPTSRSW